MISSTCAAPCDLLALTSRDAVIIAFPRQCRFRRARIQGNQRTTKPHCFSCGEKRLGPCGHWWRKRLAFGETHSKLRFVAPLSPCIREADDVASMRGRGGWSRRIKKSASNSSLIEGIVCVCITVRCHHDFSSFSRRVSLLSESKNAPLGNQTFFKLQENGQCRDATPPRTCTRPTKPSS